MGFLGDLTKAATSGLTGGVSGLISGGIASLGSQLFGSNSDQKRAFEYQKQLQQLQNDWQAQQNQKAMDFQRKNWIDQFNMTNEYNSPTASVQRLISAGLNPAGALNNAGNTSASVGGMQGVANGSPVGSVGAPIASLSIDNRKAISEMIASMSGSARNTADASRTNMLANAELNNLIAKTNNEEAQAYFTQLQTKLQGMFGGRKMQSEINALVAQMANSYADVQKKLAECKTMEELQEVYKSQVDVNWATAALNNAKVHLSRKELSKMEIDLKYYDAWMRNELGLQRARIADSLASANDANARANSGMYKNQAEFTAEQTKYQKMMNTIESIRTDLVTNKFGPADRDKYINTLRAELDNIINTAAISKEQKDYMYWLKEKLHKDVSMYEFKMLIDVLESAGNMAMSYYGTNMMSGAITQSAQIGANSRVAAANAWNNRPPKK